MDELVMVRESVHLGPFQTEIIEGWVKPLLGDMAHVVVTPMKVGEGQLRDSRPLPLGLHFLHAYIHLKTAVARFPCGQEHVRQSHLHSKGSACGASHVGITGASEGVVTGDGSCLRHRIQTRTHVGGGKTREAAGKIEPGWAGPLVSRKCGGSKRAGLGLP